MIAEPYVALLRTRHVPLLAGSLMLFGTGVAMAPLGIVLSPSNPPAWWTVRACGRRSQAPWLPPRSRS